MTIATPLIPPRAPAGLTLLAAGAGLWRAVDRSGRALGNIRLEHTADGDRFRAMRFDPPTRAFRTVGEFWSSADAVDSLRLGR